MNNQKKFIVLIACLILFLNYGCAGSLGVIPKSDEEFTKPISELQQQYPDITSFMPEIGKKSGLDCVPISEVREQWGDPDKVDIKWWWSPFTYGTLGAITGGVITADPLAFLAAETLVVAMFPLPTRIYTWEKGDYSIEATVDLSFLCFYKNVLLGWEWKNRYEKTDLQQ
ncbi:MAG: hypothetical protein ACM34I_08645 [bacterium]